MLDTFISMQKFNEICGKNSSINEEQFVNFLRAQESWSDYISFDYIVRYFKLKFDTNNNPIFTAKFPFDNKIKKEALYIWCICRHVMHHTDYKHFNKEYFDFVIDSKEYIDIDIHTEVKTNIHFNRLDICIELGKSVACSHKKNITYIKLNQKEIHVGKIAENTNINDIFRDNAYLKTFYTILDATIKKTLLKKTPAVVKYYLLQNFKFYKIKQIKEINFLMDSNILKLQTLTEIIPAANSRAKHVELLANITWCCDQDIVNLKNAKDHLRDILVGNVYNTLVSFIQKSPLGKYNKNIKWMEIVILLKINPKLLINLKLFLYIINAITDLNIQNELIYISWLDLHHILYECRSCSSVKIIMHYYTCISKYYTDILYEIK